MIDSTLTNANILIVDDQQDNIDVLTGLLDAKGFTNYIAIKDARKVIGLFKEFKPDLLLIDLIMPYLSGFEVMKQVNELIPANSYLPMLVLTVDIAPESKQQALAQGATDFLSKPFYLIEVDLRIKNLLKTRYLHQQLELQNLVLEEKVKERTIKLEKINIELIAAKVKAEESDKLKSEFLNQISHEIRTPMNAVLSFTNFLREDMSGQLTPDLMEYFNGIDSASQRLIRTVDLILNFSEILVGTYKPSFREFDLLKEIIERIKNDDLKTIESKGLEFNIFSVIPQAIIFGDHFSIYQIFLNLMDNSIKYTNEGSITISVSKNELGILVVIKDTGIGISDEFMKTIYQPFSQEERGNSRKFDGNGLGLSLVKRYCDMNKIDIKVESEKDEGTKFTLIFTMQNNSVSL